MYIWNYDLVQVKKVCVGHTYKDYITSIEQSIGVLYSNAI